MTMAMSFVFNHIIYILANYSETPSKKTVEDHPVNKGLAGVRIYAIVRMIIWVIY